MIPLRVVAVDTLGLPEGSKRGTIMDIERAVLLFLLEPDTLYYPNDIALLAFTWELQQGPLNAAQSKQLKRHRSAFSQMAVHAGLGSAVQLSGRTWAGLVKAARPELAKFMKHLADTQANQPGVIFTLFEGQLIPYPDQGASTAPPLPPCGRNITRIMEYKWALFMATQISQIFLLIQVCRDDKLSLLTLRTFRSNHPLCSITLVWRWRFGKH